MDLSQKEIERLEDIVQRLKSCETYEAISLLWQLREDTAGERTDSSDDSQHGTVLRDTGSLVPFVDRHPLVARQTLLSTGSDTMPTEHTTSLAVQAYFAQGDPIFHVMNKKRCDDLISRVYHSSTTPSPNDICELFAIAAAGCHFQKTQAQDSSMSNFIQHCSVRLFEEPAKNALQKIRCYLGLSLCWDPTRSTISRSLICKLLTTNNIFPLISEQRPVCS
jgi:hypothetical protein